MMSNSSNSLSESLLNDEIYICHFTCERDLEYLEENLDELIENTNKNNNKNKGKNKSEITCKSSLEFLPFQLTYCLYDTSFIIFNELNFIKNSISYLIFS